VKTQKETIDNNQEMPDQLTVEAEGDNNVEVEKETIDWDNEFDEDSITGNNDEGNVEEVEAGLLVPESSADELSPRNINEDSKVPSEKEEQQTEEYITEIVKEEKEENQEQHNEPEIKPLKEFVRLALSGPTSLNAIFRKCFILVEPYIAKAVLTYDLCRSTEQSLFLETEKSVEQHENENENLEKTNGPFLPSSDEKFFSFAGRLFSDEKLLEYNVAQFFTQSRINPSSCCEDMLLSWRGWQKVLLFIQSALRFDMAYLQGCRSVFIIF
jgi:hypothetical protein